VGPSQCEAAAILEDSRSGFVVAPGDVDGAVRAIRTLSRSPALREDMGRNARDYYEYYFGRDKSVARIIEILEGSYNSAGGNGHRRDANRIAAAPSKASLWQRIVALFRSKRQ
jgi:hypothetical protein